MRKVLFFQWHSFLNQGMERALQKLHIAYDTFFYQFTDWEKDDTFQEKFREKIKGKGYTEVLSVNFAPLISEVCEEVSVQYIAWVYDSPVHIRKLDSFQNSCNKIYFFDRGQAEGYRKEGVNAFHMPLAVDTEVFQKSIQGVEKNFYQAEISFVGNLYQTEYNYFVAPLREYTRGYLEGIIEAQRKLYGGYLLPELITQNLLDNMNANYEKVSEEGFCMGKRELEYLLACETTARERYIALDLLSGHYKVDVYTDKEDERLKDVRYRGYADYYTQMPLVFSESKINLNISLKTIQTGIPLRAIDVMGCGGFLLSNYQEELAEYFRIDKECVVYESIEDMFLKAKYYLEHEEERERVAQNGFERVKRDFTFCDRLKKMLEVV